MGAASGRYSWRTEMMVKCKAVKRAAASSHATLTCSSIPFPFRKAGLGKQSPSASGSGSGWDPTLSANLHVLRKRYQKTRKIRLQHNLIDKISSLICLIYRIRHVLAKNLIPQSQKLRVGAGRRIESEREFMSFMRKHPVINPSEDL